MPIIAYYNVFLGSQTAFEELDDIDMTSTDYEDTDDDAPSVYDGDTWRSRSRIGSVASGRLSSRKRLDSVSSDRLVTFVFVCSCYF